MTVFLFVGTLALISLLILYLVKRERNKEKKRFENLVKKVNEADSTVEKDASESEAVSKVEPEFTPHWKKHEEALSKATEELGSSGEALVQVFARFQESASRRNDADTGVRWYSAWPDSDDPLEADRVYEKLVRLACALIDAKAQENLRAKELNEAANLAKLAWERVSGHLAKLPTIEIEDVPVELRPLVSAALYLKKHYHGTIKETLETAIAYQEHLLPPDGQDHLERIKDKLEAVKDAIGKALVKEILVDTACDEAKNAYQSTDGVSSSQFRPLPAKPTEEEVVRFLKLYQGWSEERLPELREAHRTAALFRAELQELENLVKAVSKAIAKLPPLKGKNSCKVSSASYDCASHFESKLNERLKNLQESLESVLAGQKDTSEPKEIGTAREDELAENLWALSRKLAYAIAQKRIAEAKADAHRHKGLPSEGRMPKPQGQFKLSEYLAEHKAYLAISEAYADAVDLHNANAEVLAIAVSARQEKIEACANILMEAANAAAKEIGDNISDPLRIRLLFADRLASTFQTNSSTKTVIGPRPFY